uniref:Uncharacterized protein n=1 Tax=Megaselia scalaris TaxID=36166 RepID=T1GER4_MEGSC
MDYLETGNCDKKIQEIEMKIPTQTQTRGSQENSSENRDLPQLYLSNERCKTWIVKSKDPLG